MNVNPVSRTVPDLEEHKDHSFAHSLQLKIFRILSNRFSNGTKISQFPSIAS
jgi:hypothetical protein